MSDQFEISAKITADDSGFQSAFDRMESGLEEWGINLDKMYEEGASVFKKFGVDIDQFASKLGTTGPQLATSVGIALAAFEGLKKVIEETTEEYAEDETAQLKFNAAIKANSQLTEGANERLSGFAESFAKLTGEANSAAQSQIAMLSATGRNEEQITKTMQAALGLANATGTDLNTALTQVNQTFSGTTGRLARTTPELASLTKEELENGKAVDVLLNKYGAFTDALKNSSDVSIKDYNNSIGELKSVMGGWFEETVKPLRDLMTQFITFLVTNKEAVIGVFNGLTVAIGAMGVAIGIATGGVLPIIGAIVSAAVGLAGIFSTINHALGTSKQSYDDGKTSIDNYTTALNKLTTAQLESEKADLTRQLAQAKGGLGTRAVAEQLEVINKLLKERTDIDDNDKAKQKADEKTKAEQTYHDAIESTNSILAAGLISQEDATNKNIDATQSYLEALAKLGFTGTEAFTNAKKSLDEYKKSLSILPTTNNEILQQEKEVAEWEDAYRKKKAEEEKAAASEQEQRQKLYWETYNRAMAEAYNSAMASRSWIDILQSNWNGFIAGITAQIKDAFSKDKIGGTIASFAQDTQKILTSMFSYIQSNIDTTLKKAKDAIDKALKDQEDALDAQMAMDEKAAGIKEETQDEIYQDNIDKLKSQLLTETDATKAAEFQKQLAAAESEKKKYDIEQEYAKKKKELEAKAAKDKAQAEYQAAMDTYNLQLAQAISSAALAIIQCFATMTPVAAAIASVVVASTTAFQIATIENSKPTPPSAAATGTDYSVAGYYKVGEVGPETVYLPQGSKVYNASETSAGIKRSSNNNVVVNITSPTAMDVGEANRLFKRTQRELVFSGAYA